jgi:VWFA-related protein
MKISIALSIFVVFVPLCSAQTPSPSPESARIKNFGHSLEKYNEKKNKSKNEKTPNEQKRGVTNTDDEEVIRVETDLVLQDVLVTDRAGNVISGLTKSDFVVLEDGVPQSVEIFSFGTRSTVPRSIVLILDCGLGQLPYLRMSVQAAKLLVDKLAPQDKMAIVTADGMLQRDFTADKAQLKETLDYVEKKGRELPVWALRGMKVEELRKFQTLEKFKTVEEILDAWRVGPFGSLIAVLNEMFDEQGQQRVILFQGDGTHVAFLKPDNPYSLPHVRLNSTGKYRSMTNFGFSDVRETIERSHTSIYSIITGIRFLGLPEKEQKARAKIASEIRNKTWENTPNWMREDTSDVKKKRDRVESEHSSALAGQAAMYKVAELSGGNTAVMEKPEDAERIYSDIFAVIQNRYVLGFYPKESKTGPKRRTVKVEVRGHPEYVITGRTTYTFQ